MFSISGSRFCLAILSLLIVVLLQLRPIVALPTSDQSKDSAGASPIYSQDNVRKNNHALRIKQQHRHLISGGPIDTQCEQFMDTTIEGIVPRQDCSCATALFPPSLVVECQLEAANNSSSLCIVPSNPVVCGQPGIKVSFSPLNLLTGGSPVSAEICFYNGTLFGIPVPEALDPFCISVLEGFPRDSTTIRSILQAIFGGVLPGLTLSPGVPAASSETRERTCTAQLGRNKCDSCSVCSLQVGGGVRLDCRNLVPNFVFSECTVLPSLMGV